MTPLITLPEIKEHLRIFGAEEDTLLSTYAEAAGEYVCSFTGKDWPAEVDVPTSIKAAMLLIIGDLYENREAQMPTALHANKAVERLLWPYREF